MHRPNCNQQGKKKKRTLPFFRSRKKKRRKKGGGKGTSLAVGGLDQKKRPCLDVVKGKEDGKYP